MKKNGRDKSYIYSERVSFVIALQVISEILQFSMKLYVDIRKSIEKASCFLKKRMNKNFYNIYCYHSASNNVEFFFTSKTYVACTVAVMTKLMVGIKRNWYFNGAHFCQLHLL